MEITSLPERTPFTSALRLTVEPVVEETRLERRKIKEKTSCCSWYVR